MQFSIKIKQNYANLFLNKIMRLRILFDTIMQNP